MNETKLILALRRRNADLEKALKGIMRDVIVPATTGHPWRPPTGEACQCSGCAWRREVAKLEE